MDLVPLLIMCWGPDCIVVLLDSGRAADWSDVCIFISFSSVGYNIMLKRNEWSVFIVVVVVVVVYACSMLVS